MCRVEVRIYISADGHRSKFEESFPCANARNGELCAQVKRRTTEYFPKANSVAPRDASPRPCEPPTQIQVASNLIQPRRPSQSEGVLTAPINRPKDIIIEFGSKRDGVKASKGGSSKRSSLGAVTADEDAALESPDENAAYKVRTGSPPLPQPSPSHLHVDGTTSIALRRNRPHHRHTSSNSSYIESSRTPSLNMTSEADSDSADTRLLPPTHRQSKAKIPASFDVDSRSDSGYSSFTARTGSSVGSAWSNPATNAPVLDAINSEVPEIREKKTDSALKQVRFVYSAQKSRRPVLYHAETRRPLPASHRQIIEHAHATGRYCGDPMCSTCGFRTRPQHTRRPSISSRDSSLVSRPTVHGTQVPSPTAVYICQSNDSDFFAQSPPSFSNHKYDEYYGPTIPTPILPSSNRRRPKFVYDLDGRPTGLPTPNASPEYDFAPDSSSIPVPDPMSRQRRSAIVAELTESVRRGHRRDEERRRELEREIMFSGKDTTLRHTKRDPVIITQSIPPKEPHLGSTNTPAVSTLPTKNDMPKTQSLSQSPPLLKRQPRSGTALDISPKGESDGQSNTHSSKEPASSESLNPDQNYQIAQIDETSSQFKQLLTADGPFHVVKQTKPYSEDVTKPLVLLPKVQASNVRTAHINTGLDENRILPEPDGDTPALNEEDNGTVSSEESFDDSNEGSEDCDVHVDDALNSAMSVVKSLLLRELLEYTLPDATDASGGTNTSSSGSASSPTSRSLASSSGDSQTPSKSKRQRGGSRDPGDGDGDNSDDDDDRPKKKGARGFPDRFPQRRLKCPFYQRQPDKYVKAACRGSGFVDMAKLKDHIKRVHTQPLRCSRCWLEMCSDEAYSEHLQQDSICAKAPKPDEDRILPQLLKRLDFKKAPYSNARNVEEKWKMLFKVLFPGDSTTPSPYEQQGMSPQLERALYEALEEELTRELALVIEPIMEKIKGCIPAIIERCREKLRSSASSSDDEVVLTPSSSPSVASSGKGGCGSTTRQDSPQSGSFIPLRPENSLDASLDTYISGGPSQKSTVQASALCADSLIAIDQQGMFTTRFGTDQNIQEANHYDASDYSEERGLSNIPGLDHGITGDMVRVKQPHDYIPATANNSASTSRDEGVTLELYDSSKSVLQQDFSSSPSHPQAVWSGGEASWPQKNTTPLQCAEHTLPEVNDGQGWESFLWDFDINSGRS